MKKLKLSLFFFNLWISAQEDIYVTKKDFPLRDITSYTVMFKTIPNWREFQINLSKHPLEIIPNANLMFGIPAIGNYGPTYNFRKRLALILINPKFLFSVKDNKKITDLQDPLKKLDIYISAIILGNLLNLESPSSNNSYNLVYHPWAGLWNKNKKNNSMKYFNENIDLGIFEPHGIKKAGDLTYGTWSPIFVSWHDPFSISPDNARIHIENNREFSTFISVASSQNKEHISINIFLLANTQKSEEFIARILHNSKNLSELEQNINKAISENKEKFNSQDLEAIINWKKYLAQEINGTFLINPKLTEDQIKSFSDLSMRLNLLKN